MSITLDQISNNATVVTIGALDLFFSYNACIAFRLSYPGEYVQTFNPSYRNYSQSTTKHAGQMGCKSFTDSMTFEADLAVAMAHPGVLS